MSFKYSACFTSYQIICRVMWDHMRSGIAAPKSGVELTENFPKELIKKGIHAAIRLDSSFTVVKSNKLALF